MTDPRLPVLADLERKVLWLATWMIHNANNVRSQDDGLKVGGHQASSASLATIMTALYFAVLRPEDRVAVKPHASPIFHAIQYLFGNQDQAKLEDVSRARRCSVLSLAHQGCGRCRFLDRLGGLGRRADALRLAGAGLCARQGPGHGASGRPHGGACRRCRDGRGQYLRGLARGLEAWTAQLLVDRRLQSPKSRCGGARRSVATLRGHLPQFRLGCRHPEIWRAARSGLCRAWR